jgi:indolepyruvate ferredoxin oxidoreductase beta subunit
VAFLGVLSRYVDVDESVWKEVVSSMLPPKLVEVNLKAFALGRNTG